MALTVFIATAGALAIYDDWTAFFFLFNVLFFAYLGLLAYAITTDSPFRPFLVGFAIVGLGYLLISGSHIFQPYLYTTHFLNHFAPETADNAKGWTSYPPANLRYFFVNSRDLPAFTSIGHTVFSFMFAIIAGYCIQSLAKQSKHADNTS